MINKTIRRLIGGSGSSDKPESRAYEGRIRELEREVRDLSRSLEDARRRQRHAEDRLKRERRAMEKERERFEDSVIKQAKWKAEELAEEKAQKIIREREKALAEKDRVRRQAAGVSARREYDEKIKEIQSEAEQKVREAEDKLRSFVGVVINDDELLQILLNGELSKDRFRVIRKADRNPSLAKRIKRSLELGDVETTIKLESEEMGEREQPIEVEGELPEAPSGIIEELGGEELETASEREEESFDQILEDLDSKSLDVLEALHSGYTSAGQVASYIGVSERTVLRKYRELKEHGLIETGTVGTSVTDRGEELLKVTGR